MKRASTYALAGVLIIGNPLFAQSNDESDAGGPLVRLLENTLSNDDRQIKVVGLEGALSARATIEEIVVTDDDGPWFTLKGAVLDWNRLALVRGRFSVNELSADSIELARLPEPSSAPSTDLPSPETEPFALPELPVAILIDKMSIGEVILGEPVIGTAATLSLNGNFSLADGALDTLIDLDRLDRQGDGLSLKAAYANETRNIDLDVTLTEAPGGLLSNVLDLPGAPSISFTARGDGPVEDFTADIALATDGTERFGGEVVLRGEPAADGGDAQALSFDADLGGDLTALLDPAFHPFFGDNAGLKLSGVRQPTGAMVIDNLDLSAEAVDITGQLALSDTGAPISGSLNGLVAPSTDVDNLILPVSGAETSIESASIIGEVDASGEGAWSLNLVVEGFKNEAATIETLSLEGDGAIQLGDNTSLDGEIAASVLGLGLPDDTLSATMGQNLQLTSEFALPGDGTFNVSSLRVFGAGLEALASAQISGLGSGFELDGNASLSVADLGRFAELTGQDLSGQLSAELTGKGAPLGGQFDVVLNGTANSIAVGIPQADALLAGETTLKVDAERGGAGIDLRTFEIANPQLDVTGSGAIRSNSTTLDLTAQLVDLGLVVPQLPGAAELRASAEQNGTVWTGDARFDGPDEIFAALAGDVTTKGGADVTIDAAFPGLERFVPQLVGTATLAGTVSRDEETGAAIAKLTLNGPQELSADIDGTVNTDNQADLRFDAGIGALEAFVPQLVGAASLTGTVNADINAQSATADITLDGPEGVNALVDGTIAAEGETDLVISARMPKLELFVPQLPGLASVDGTLTRTGPSDDWDAKVTVRAPQDIAADLDASLAPDGATDIDLDATLPKLETFVPQLPGPATLAVSADRQANSEDWIAQAKLRAPQEISADVNGVANPQGSLDMRLLANVPQLESFVPQLVGLARVTGEIRRSVEGAWVAQTQVTAPTDISATVNATMTEGGPLDAKLRANVPQLETFVPQLPGAARLVGDITRAENGEDWSGTANLTAPEDITARANGSFNSTGPVDLTLDADVPGIERFVTQLPGTLTLDANVTRANADADWVGQFNLAGPEGLSLDANGAADLDGAIKATLEAGFDRLEFFAPTLVGPITLGGQIERAADGKEWSGQTTLNAPGDIVADLKGTLTEQGGSSIAFDANIPGMDRFVPDFPGTLTSTGTATRKAGQWTVDAETKAPGGSELVIAGGYNETDSTADLAVNGQLQLAAANRILEPNSIQGLTRFDLAIKGPPGLDAVSGTITTNDVSIAIPAIQNAINNFGGDITLANSQAQIALGGDLRTGGSLRIEGPLALSAPFDSTIDVVLQSLKLTDNLSYETVLDGGIRLSGPLTGGANLSGQINIGETEINIATVGGAPGAGAIPEINHIGESQAELLTRQRAGLVVEETEEESADGGGPPIGLDLVVSAPNRIFVRGRGLESELGGQIEVKGTASDPRPEGSIELLRGHLSILTRRLDLTRGIVTLSGSLEPNLDFAATTSTSEGDATLTIEGPLSDPEVLVTSDPERPSEEALAMLVFGDQFSNLSPVKVAQLAASLARLRGGGGGLTSGLREGLGVDSVDFTTDDDGNAAVGVGTYLSDNIYTDVSINARGDTEVNINLDVSDSVTVKGSVDNESNTSIGIFFERDY